jgi:hypothetical protein
MLCVNPEQLHAGAPLRNPVGRGGPDQTRKRDHHLKASIASCVSRFRRRIAAAGAAAALAASSMLVAQPVAADTTYPVFVTFDNVRFAHSDDGCFTIFCATDPWLDIYGTVGAYTTSGVSSADGSMAYRLFGLWGTDSCEVDWPDNDGTTCAKEVTDAYIYDFSKVFLCNGSYYKTCSTTYAKSNNVIALHVRPGEQIKVTTLMQDYDSLSSDDVVCNGHLLFGPYTAAQLQAKKYISDARNQTIQMGFNGNAECFVAFHFS